jgi:hypothetical protein
MMIRLRLGLPSNFRARSMLWAQARDSEYQSDRAYHRRTQTLCESQAEARTEGEAPLASVPGTLQMVCKLNYGGP